MASLVYMPITQFVESVVRDKDMTNAHIIIISNSIIGSITRKGAQNEERTESKYKNVEFVENLYPEPVVQTYADRYSGRDMFRDAYIDQITRDDNFGDVCAIVDLIANKDKDVILLTGPFEYSMGFFDVLAMFLEEHFGLVSASQDKIERGDVSLREIDTANQDIEAIRKNLADCVVKTMGIEDMDDLYNRFCDSLEEKYKEILMRKPMDKLIKIAEERGYKINSNLEKEEYVDRLFDRMFPRNSLG